MMRPLVLASAWLPLAAAGAAEESLPSRGYDPNASYDAGAGYDADAGYDPNAGYQATAAYLPKASFDPTASFQGPALLVVLDEARDVLVAARIQAPGWFADLPDSHVDREQVQKELEAWSSSDDLATQIERLERATRAAAAATPLAAAERRLAEGLRDHLRALAKADAAGRRGDSREQELCRRQAQNQAVLVERAQKARDTLRRRASARKDSPAAVASASTPVVAGAEQRLVEAEEQLESQGSL